MGRSGRHALTGDCYFVFLDFTLENLVSRLIRPHDRSWGEDTKEARHGIWPAATAAGTN